MISHNQNKTSSITDSDKNLFLKPIQLAYHLTDNAEHISNNLILRLPDIPFYHAKQWGRWRDSSLIKKISSPAVEAPEAIYISEPRLVSSAVDNSISMSQEDSFIQPTTDIEGISPEIENKIEAIATIDDAPLTDGQDELHSTDSQSKIIMQNIDNQSDKHSSFYEWLMMLRDSNKPSESIKNQNSDENIVTTTQDKLVGSIKKEAPTVKKNNPKPKDEIQEIIASSNVIDREIVSETLAELYVMQGHSDKAIAMYKKLSLKYPEKASIFAALIDKIKK